MNKAGERGFTMLELSIVLVLIGIIIGGGLTIFTASVQSSALNNTVARMDMIEKTLLNFAIVNSRLPCPSDITQLTSAASYGVEAANPGTCTGGTPAASFSSSAGTVEGGVPTRALRLSDDFIYDSWGHRFRYGVDPLYTAAGSLPAAANCSLTSAPTSTSITVQDATGTARSASVVYAIVSHGANGHGAYTSGAGIVSTGSTNTGELANCHCTSAGAAGTYSGTYVAQAPSLDSTSSTNGFDDIVTFKEAWEIQAPNFSVNSMTCSNYLLMTDQSNNRVQEFDAAGNFLMGIGRSYQGVAGSAGASGSANGAFNNPQGIAVDSVGNIWVADEGNQRIQKFSSSGVYISQLGSCASGACSSGSANGSFNNPVALAFDSGGNIFVVDQGNNQIQEFSSSGTYLNKFGTSGSGNYQLTTPVSVRTDSSNNVWVLDKSTNIIKEFTNAGVYTQQFSTGGSTWDFNFDTGGNIWATDYQNYRVEEYNSSGTLLAKFGTQGTGNTQFKVPDGITIDSGGNVWVSDNTLQNIKEFTPAGIYVTQRGCSSGSCSSGTANGQFNVPGMLTFTSSSR